MRVSLNLRIIITLVIALLVAFCLYALIIKFYVDPYLENYSDLNRGSKIFEFYNNEISPNKVYFWGSSSTKEDIDTSLIDKLNDSFNHYNLGNPASTPLRRTIELSSAINSKPKAVVICVGPMSLSNSWLFPHDQYALISKYIKNDPKLDLYNEIYKQLLDMNRFELLIYKRKFIYPATNIYIDLLRYKLLGAQKPLLYKKYNEDFKSEGTLSQLNASHNPEFEQKLKEKEDFSEYNVSSEKNIEKESFEYIIQRLLENEIKVIIVKIPLNQKLLRKIPYEYKNNFNIFITDISEKYNIPVLDYIDEYSISYFYDGHHLNRKGREKFSEDLGLNVIKIIGESQDAV